MKKVNDTVRASEFCTVPVPTRFDRFKKAKPRAQSFKMEIFTHIL